MDFYKIVSSPARNKEERMKLRPDFIVGRSQDLMVRGKSFYAIWDEELQIWSTDEYDVQRLVDTHLTEESLKGDYDVLYLRNFSSNSWSQYRKFIGLMSDNSRQLDENLTFSNTEVSKNDYVSKRLPYPLSEGDHSAWDELMDVLYDPEEKAKVEWAIGSIISGDSKKLQKFIVLYGSAGTGKSTVLNIIQKLFEGYYTTFEAKALTSSNNAFSTEAFKYNPLVAIQHDGDLSRIEDNTKLNSIVSHEEMTMNEKYKPSYSSRINAFLFMGTNKPVKITDAKSGIIRRLIDVRPTGNKIPSKHYQALMTRIDFELGAIAHHCLEVYREMGKNYYNTYRPNEMMMQTDVFFNFIEAHFDIFKSQDGTSLKQAYDLYKVFCEETLVDFKLPRHKFREELKNYFDNFSERDYVDGHQITSWYSGFDANKFKVMAKDEGVFSLSLDEKTSLLDDILKDQPAQYATKDDIPKKPWDLVDTKLSDIDTAKVHYVRVPENHIVIDFDLTDDEGNKSSERNLEAASAWPPTYAEFSKGGQGIHLHYIYDGDASELAREYAPGVEIKVYSGHGSLRRKLSLCNNVPISTINSGLPLKEKKVLHANTIQSERGLRELIERNLRKEIHPGTKPSVDFIHKILEDAYLSGMDYDLSDMRPKILAFANNSTNQPLQAIKMVQLMKFKSENSGESVHRQPTDDRLVFFDVEVYPNLFVVCWKYAGDANVVKMRNPTPQDIEQLFGYKLVGFNCRRYDNHMLYARFMGYDNERLYQLSQKIINNDRNGMFGEAYSLSYADIYDFSSIKQTLKKFEIELGIKHVEMDLPWDEPVPDDRIEDVENYCCNDVVATEVVFNSRRQDFVARQILAELSGLTVNDTTQKHTAKIIFGNDRDHKDEFVYTDLSEIFPGYEFDRGKSSYRGEDPSEGGYVYAEPGMYDNVAVLDVASMHPTSIEQLNLFGGYTQNFSDLKAARLAIKRRDFVSARKMLDGRLEPYLTDEEQADALSYALKIVINIVYGLTSAKFDNPFKDNRNIDNIVAKRGALFMIELKKLCQDKGIQVVHIKTDSIKIPNATPEITDMIMEFGAKYGYEFELEDTYDRFCLVNDAVYIACSGSKWTAVGTQFAHPYVHKTLFTHEEIAFDDLCETKQVTQGAMYLDFDAESTPMFMAGKMQFVGKTGRFVPVMPETGGGVLYRVKDDKCYSVSGTKGYFWVEATVAENLGEELEIDLSYFENLVKEAKKTIEKFGSFDKFLAPF